MALNIDKKVYRSLQEQVAYLTTTVAEIIDVTDAEKLEEYIEQFSIWSDTMTTWSNTMSGYATTMSGYANTMNGYSNEMAGWRSEVSTWENNIALAAATAISGQDITPNSVSANTILEINTGYSFEVDASFASKGGALDYVGVVKTGNKITFVASGTFTKNANTTANVKIGDFIIPSVIGNKLIPNSINYLDNRVISLFANDTDYHNKEADTYKIAATVIMMRLHHMTSDLTEGTPYAFRYEVTFLLSESLL